MPGSDKDEEKTLEELMKKIAAQQKQTAEMLKLMEQMQKQKLLADMLTAMQKQQADIAKAITKNLR